jgi:hypothetical protein
MLPIRSFAPALWIVPLAAIWHLFSGNFASSLLAWIFGFPPNTSRILVMLTARWKPCKVRANLLLT